MYKVSCITYLWIVTCSTNICRVELPNWRDTFRLTDVTATFKEVVDDDSAGTEGNDRQWCGTYAETMNVDAFDSLGTFLEMKGRYYPSDVLVKDSSVDPHLLGEVHRGSYYLTSGKLQGRRNCLRITRNERRKMKVMKRSTKSERTLTSCMHGDAHGME